MSWVQELINRYQQTPDFRPPNRPKRHEYRPLRPEVKRPNLDPSFYYSSLDKLQDISKEGTKVIEQIAMNRKREEERLAREREKAALFQFGETNQKQVSRPKTGAQGLSQPLGNYRITSGYGNRHHPIYKRTKFHTGIDMAAPSGTPIYATHAGTVQSAGSQGGYGNLVILGGGNGLQTYYAHQAKVAVKPGQQVQQGQLIGYVGSTGVSTGPHLHYEVRINGQIVNPSGYL